MENITKETWKELIAETPDAQILDVRTPGECMEGIQPKAKQLNFLDGAGFMNGIEELDKDKTYFIYCKSGGRSEQAASIMASKGFKTYNLLGGMMNWDGEVVAP